MKGISIALTVVTVILALSQLICGLWLQSHGVTPESASFHASLGIGTLIAMLITFVALWMLVGQRGKAQAS
jgi:Mg2+ and Co2+ transporter CorA